jgi:two-component system nitrate/nitrite response regulator NarL
MSEGIVMRCRGCDIVLVGPNGLVHEGLTRILRAANFRLVASVANLWDVDLKSVSKHQSILLILEFSTDPGTTISQIVLFKEQFPLGQVVVLAEGDQVVDMVAAFQAGANAYLPKDVACRALIKVLELVMLGETILPPSLLSCIRKTEQNEKRSSTSFDSGGPALSLVQIEGSGLPRLSSREKTILHCIIGGASNKVIARKITIAEATVKVHVKTILRKIRASNRTQAAVWAMNHASLIWPEDPHPSPSQLEVP